MQPRARVIIDNDFSGDPDDLFQLVHHVLSPSVRIPFVIGSHLPVDDLGDPSDQQATNAARIAKQTLGLLGAADRIPVYEGSNRSLPNPVTPIDNEAARAIIAEALRDDTDTPLFVALGAGLTALASALLLEPRIADRLTAIWIGGPEYADLADPPPGARIEYNLSIDLAAGQMIFNQSSVALWQVPRDVYRQCLISRAELDARVRPMGDVGRFLAEAIDRVATLVAERRGGNLGETYALGDSPLVLLTALQSAFEPTPSSSAYVTRPMPRLSPEGRYIESDEGRPVRVYTRVDTRLMFEDFFWKLASQAAA